MKPLFSSFKRQSWSLTGPPSRFRRRIRRWSAYNEFPLMGSHIVPVPPVAVKSFSQMTSILNIPTSPTIGGVYLGTAYSCGPTTHGGSVQP
jgi:hypothetical protein